MASFFEDLLKGLSGGVGLASDIQNLIQGQRPSEVKVTTAAPPLPPSQFEQQLRQLTLGSTLAAQQEGGYQVVRNPDGSITLQQRPLTPEETLRGNLSNQVNAGLLNELSGFGGAQRTLQSPLASVLNTQAQASATGQPSGLNRQALIAAIQARKGGAVAPPAGGTNLPPINIPAFGPEPQAPQVTTSATFGGGRGGLAGGGGLGLPLALGGAGAGLVLANKLGLLGKLGGLLGAGGGANAALPTSVSPLSTENVPPDMSGDWMWVPDNASGMDPTGGALPTDFLGGLPNFDFGSLSDPFSIASSGADLLGMGF